MKNFVIAFFSIFIVIIFSFITPSYAEVKSYPDVNRYINSKKLPVARTEYNHIMIFPKMNYRYGYGRVEGVVAHETANDNSSITNEINYMVRHYNNAFVHAFVDHSRIIEIHPTDLKAWGAGKYANPRFVHVELVRVKTFDQFARSINNYASYIANILYRYNLGVTSAETAGQGTLWSHRAVSIHLGGTDHVDPHGYFQKWGYNWNQFVTLVKQKYNELTAKRKQYTSKLGHIRSRNVRIYPNPLNPANYMVAGEKYTNQVYYIKQESSLNGIKYYLLSLKPSNREGLVGWVKAQDLTVQEHVGIKNNKQEFVVTGAGKAYNKAWGGQKNIIYNTLSAFEGKQFVVNLTEKVGNTIWFRGSLNGKQIWIQSNYLSKQYATSLLGHIRNSNVQIHKKIGDSTSSFKAGSQYTNQVYYIKKQAIVSGQKYYLISLNPSSTSGVVGWVRAENMAVNSHKTVDKQGKTYYLKGTGSAYRKAWGGKKDLVYENLSQFTDQVFHVHLTENVGKNVWYRGTLNGKTVFIHSSYVTKAQETATSKLGHIRTRQVKIYKTLGDPSTAITSDAEYTNQVYYIKKQVSVNGQVYYLLSLKPSSTNGVVGWAKAEDVSINTHKTVDKQAKLFTIIGNGSAYNKAWGGKKNIVYTDLSDYKGKEFKVDLTEKVGNNTWYRGLLDNKKVWIHSVNLADTRTTSKLGHIRTRQVKIYKTLGDPSTAITSGVEYTNRVYYIKKQATFNGDLYYLISLEPSSINGVVGWVQAKNMSVNTHKAVDKQAKLFTIKGIGSAYSKAWGGKKDVVYENLSPYKGKAFEVHLTETVGKNTWYRGRLDGKIVWVHESFIKR